MREHFFKLKSEEMTTKVQNKKKEKTNNKTCFFLLSILNLSLTLFHSFMLLFYIFMFGISICVSYFYGPTRTFDKVISNLTFHNRGGSNLLPEAQIDFIEFKSNSTVARM